MECHPTSEKIRDRMRELGLTQAQLARRSGVSQGRISELLNGKRRYERMRLANARRLAEALGVTPDFFWPVASHLGDSRGHRRK
jgi:transcriptional regulator with XRE-family HTH domain